MANVLVIILHYNSFYCTESLYANLKPYECRGDYDLLVFDNGSDMPKRPRAPSIRFEKNTYFGGGLNHAFAFFLDHNKWDALLFLNSDLVIHGPNFVRALYKGLKDGNYALVSPSILQPGNWQIRWKQMHNWNSSEIRDVRWIDFQAPLFSKDFISRIRSYPQDLARGWGQDVLSGLLVQQWGGKIGVLDTCTIAHGRSISIRENQGDPDIKNYNQIALTEMKSFIKKSKLEEEWLEMQTWADNYSFHLA